MWLTKNLDWLFLISVNLVLLFCVFVACSPLGKVRFGGPDAKPEFSYLTWIAMLFAAGIDTGLLFFGAAEPVTYFQSPPLNILPETAAAAAVGIAATSYHWGFHAWATYCIVGLVIGFAAHNRGSHSRSAQRFTRYLAIASGAGPDILLIHLLFSQHFLGSQPPSD